MNFSPNAMAVLVALLYGIGVFPWTVLSGRVGPQGVLMFVGGCYFVVGALWALVSGTSGPVTPVVWGWGITTGIIFAGAVSLYSIMLAHPQVNVAVSNAITATYPVVTVLVGLALTAVGLATQRITGLQAVLMLTCTASVVGLAMTTKS